MIILFYFIASVFIVLGFMMLFAFYRTRRKELLLLSFVYSASGLAAGYSMKWWILIAGFIVAWLLRFAGFDPGKPPKGSTAESNPEVRAGAGKK